MFLTWTSTADGVLVRTDETFCSDWSWKKLPFSPQWHASINLPHGGKHHNFRSVDSGTCVLLWPPAEPLLEAAQHDICVSVSDWAATAAADLFKEKFNILGNTPICFCFDTTHMSAHESGINLPIQTLSKKANFRKCWSTPLKTQAFFHGGSSSTVQRGCSAASNRLLGFVNNPRGVHFSLFQKLLIITTIISISQTHLSPLQLHHLQSLKKTHAPPAFYTRVWYKIRHFFVLSIHVVC